MASVINIENISKFYVTINVVDSLSLEVGKGNIFGFLGPNGAAETTTTRILPGGLLIR